MYQNFSQWLALATEQEQPLWRIALANEEELTGLSEAAIWTKLQQHWQVMRQEANKALTQPCPSALISGIARQQQAYAAQEKTFCGPFLNHMMARALSCSETNASLGRICAAPTAGSCGILPAVLLALEERFSYQEKEILIALLTAAAIGAVVMKNATVSGAEGGCQAECGVAGAMAAGAAVQLAGGGNETILHAFCLVLMNVMGLVCDPVAGLIQVPCAQRNASQAVNALLCADLALAGMTSPVPADQMVEALYLVGKAMPVALRETAQGGMAATAAAQAIAQKIFQPLAGENAPSPVT